MTNNGFNSYPTGERESNSYHTPQSRDSLDLDLGEYLLKLKRRWKPAILVFLATVGSTIFLSLFLDNSYQAQGKLLFKPNSTASLTGVGEGASGLSNLEDSQTPLNNELEKITAAPVLQATIDELGLKDGEGEPLKPKDFARKLKVELVGGSDVIQVSYDSKDPEFAAKIVNSLMNVYVNEQVLNNQRQPANAREFINRQLPQIEGKVKTAESELEEFRTSNSVIDLNEEKKIIVQELGILNREIASIGSSYQGKQAQTQAIQNQLGLNFDQALAVNQLGNTPSVQSILESLATTEKELAKERQRFTDTHPIIASLQEKKGNLRQQLESSIARSVGEGVKVADGVLNVGDRNQQTILENFINLKIEELSLQRQLTGIAEAQQKYLERAKELPRLEKREQELLRRSQTANKTYTNLLESLADVELATNQQTGNIEIIETAITPESGSSGRIPLIALGTIAGLLLANLTAIALEWKDRTIKSISEIKKKLPYKVVGIIPQVEELARSGVLVRQEPDSYVSELYRMLQANLKFMNAQRPPQVILITSSVPGEGKSTVTANLGAAIAQLGRRVLLVDGDLRKPSQNKLWQIDDFIGLQEVIREGRSLARAVSQPMPKLDLLLANNGLSNPLALLDSSEMAELIAQSRKTYDIILIDAPPLPVTADILTLSRMIDGILFVTRPGVVEHESAELAEETLASIDSNILGMVVNGVKSKEFERYSYSNRYGKRYFGKDGATMENDFVSNNYSSEREEEQLEITTISQQTISHEAESKATSIEINQYSDRL